jgi:hypothetical protein
MSAPALAAPGPLGTLLLWARVEPALRRAFRERGHVELALDRRVGAVAERVGIRPVAHEGGVARLEGVAGIEYNGDCWVLRLVGQRLTTTTQTNSTSIYLQIELNGLARFGTNPLEMLRRSVPGYQRTNDPTLSPKDRDDLFQEF